MCPAYLLSLRGDATHLRVFEWKLATMLRQSLKSGILTIRLYRGLNASTVYRLEASSCRACGLVRDTS